MGCCDSREQQIQPQQQPDFEVQRIRQSYNFSKGSYVKYRNGPLYKYYQITDILGEGRQSSVCIGIRKSDGSHWAIKQIQKCTQHQFAYNEIEILKFLDHPNIVSIQEVIEDQWSISLVQELCTGGELFQRIYKTKRFSERQAAVLMKELISCLIYCHQFGIVHRDIKPENILFTSQGILKLVDFGCTGIVDFENSLNEIVGTPLYMAPEVFKGQYNEKCDIWSCGVILYIILTGKPPYAGFSRWDIANKIQKQDIKFGKEWDQVSKEAKELTQSMLQKDAENRPTAQEVYDNQWMNQIKETMLVSDQFLENLNNYRVTSIQAGCRLQKAVLTYIQFKSQGPTNEFTQIFKSFDTNGDGRISAEELQTAYLQLESNSIINIQYILQNCDTNQSGYIDYSEFLTTAYALTQRITQEQLKQAFDEYDQDGSGDITIDELRRFYGQDVYESDLREIINEVDSDGDGRICFEEFKNALSGCNQLDHN